MGQEIERKFLVQGESWRHGAVGQVYCQGYLTRQPEATVRVRVVGDRGYLTIKGKTEGIRRAEYEYDIPVADAEAMLATLCPPPLIEKTRYIRTEAGLVWEIDEFAGANAGLIIAEVELATVDQAIAYPDWIGAEVSHDPRYFNASLTAYPYSTWTAESS